MSLGVLLHGIALRYLLRSYPESLVYSNIAIRNVLHNSVHKVCLWVYNTAGNLVHLTHNITVSLQWYKVM